MEKVTFTPNVPQQVALRFPDGKLTEGRFGDQMFYTTSPWFSDKTRAIVRKVTQESIVLLKNTPAPAQGGGGAGAESLLPLDKTKVKSIAVIGPSANDVFIDWYAGNL